MRSVASVVLVLALGCGTEPRTRTPSGDDLETDVDGGVTGPTPSVDAAVVPPDGIPPGLTPCEEAGYHSDFAWIQRTVFEVSCATSGCHTGASPDAGMNLSRAMAHGALVNVDSHHTDGWVRVKPGAPTASMLMVQIGGEVGPPIDGTMPWNQERLCDPQIDAIRRWIQAGALDD